MFWFTYQSKNRTFLFFETMYSPHFHGYLSQLDWVLFAYLLFFVKALQLVENFMKIHDLEFVEKCGEQQTKKIFWKKKWLLQSFKSNRKFMDYYILENPNFKLWLWNAFIFIKSLLRSLSKNLIGSILFDPNFKIFYLSSIIDVGISLQE